MKTKICKKCNVEKTIDLFFKSKKCLLGVKSSCKECCQKQRVNRNEYLKLNRIQIENKTCKACCVDYNIDQFFRSKLSSDGFEHRCKSCMKKVKNIALRANYGKTYRLNNSEKIKVNKKSYYYKNKETAQKKNKEYRILNAEKIKNNRSQHYQSNKKELSEKKKVYYLNNKETIVVKNTLWYKNNKHKYIKARSKRHKERYYNDPIYRLKKNMRSRLNLALKNNTKSGSTESLIGCTIEFLKSYLESKFLPGMSWDKRSEFHIDHIIPCASFNLSDPEQQKICFHYTNLQPLWAIDNLKKSNKMEIKKDE